LSGVFEGGDELFNFMIGHPTLFETGANSGSALAPINL
jgi:hypothetical protein